MNEKAIAVYANLMQEVKYRTETIDTLLDAGATLRAKVIEESCYLQLRMICEVIAIGCLIIQGDIPAITSALRKSYKADWIISQMAKVHPGFFPKPLEDRDAPGQDGIGHMIEKKSAALTQDDVVQLWRLCGNELHRGSAKAILSENAKELSYKEVRRWRDLIVSLLNRHSIVTPDRKYLAHIVMQDDKTGDVGWNIMEKVERPDFGIPARGDTSDQ